MMLRIPSQGGQTLCVFLIAHHVTSGPATCRGAPSQQRYSGRWGCRMARSRVPFRREPVDEVDKEVEVLQCSRGEFQMRRLRKHEGVHVAHGTRHPGRRQRGTDATPRPASAGTEPRAQGRGAKGRDSGGGMRAHDVGLIEDALSWLVLVRCCGVAARSGTMPRPWPRCERTNGASRRYALRPHTTAAPSRPIQCTHP